MKKIFFLLISVLIVNLFACGQKDYKQTEIEKIRNELDLCKKKTDSLSNNIVKKLTGIADDHFLIINRSNIDTKEKLILDLYDKDGRTRKTINTIENYPQLYFPVSLAEPDRVPLQISKTVINTVTIANGQNGKTGQINKIYLNKGTRDEIPVFIRNIWNNDHILGIEISDKSEYLGYVNDEIVVDHR